MSPPSPKPCATGERTPVALIFGIGNTLRRDDGAGWSLADALGEEACQLGMAVTVEHVQQLTPDLAAVAAEMDVDCIVFVDAAVGGEAVVVLSLASNERATVVADSHTCTPQLVLFLLATLYGRHPTAWLVTVPGFDFAHGIGLSSATAAALAAFKVAQPRFLAKLQPQ